MKNVSIKYRIEYWLIMGLECFFRLFPTAVVERMGRGLGDLFWYLFPYRFNVAYHNLGVVFPDMERRSKMKLLHNIYRHYGYVMATYYIMHRKSFRARIQAVDPEGEYSRGAGLEKGRGSVYCVFHFGHWEAFIAFLTMKGYPFSGIYKVQRNPLTDAYFIRHRLQFGDSIEHISSKAGMDIYSKSLEQNRMLGIAIDQNFRRKGITVKFFGRDFNAARGAAVLALRHRAPVFLSAFFIDGGKFRYEQKEIEVPELEGGEEESIRTVMQTLLSETEKFILRHPDQWLWFHRVWQGIYSEKVRRTWREYFI